MSTPVKSKFSVDTYYLGKQGSTTRFAYGYRDDCLLISQGHPWRNTKINNGGPFSLVKRHLSISPSIQVESGDGINGALTEYCRLIPWTTPQKGRAPTTHVGTVTADYDLSFLNGKGATGWKRTRPGNPVAGAGQFLGELRDLPSIPLRNLRKLNFFRGLGHEYLNVQFGWKPFVNDLKKMYQVYTELDKRLAQLKRDNGRAIRRHVSLEESTDTSTTTTSSNDMAAFWPTPNGIVGSVQKSTLLTQSTSYTKTWYAARYRYYIPEINSSQWTKRATRVLYGINPSPEIVWELLPWSWLIDWFSNVGDIVSNLSTNAVDNLVADYAYVMQHTRVETQYMATGQLGAASSKFGWRKLAYPAASLTESVEWKRRQWATPYGFGVDFGTLSPYQVSILGALGMSRSRF